MQKNHQSYIAEIDGLRAFAVLAVLLFHGFPQYFPGGFIGVDVFFVISGFVISRTYLQPMLDGQVGWGRFWMRRVRRLFPAYLLVLLVSTVLAYWLLEPYLLRNYGQSLAGQPFYIQNIIFWLQGDYFASAETKPLLHTWSLAVEEQFYLLFCMGILLARRIGVAVFSLWCLSFIALLSLALGYAINDISPKTSFYLLPTRVWQLALGVMAARIVHHAAPGSTRGLPLLALALTLILLAALFAFDSQSPFPGMHALFACLATFALLVLFELRRGKGYWWLTLPGLGHTGRISYSLYLWHWPPIVFLGLALQRELHWHESLGALLTAYALASLTYRYLENPVRRQQMFRSNPLFLRVFAASCVALVGFGVFLVSTSGAVYRYPEPQRTWLEVAQQKSPFRCPLTSRVLNPLREVCQMNSAPAGPGILIIGDSHADQIDNQIATQGETYGVPVYLATRNCDVDEFLREPFCHAQVLESLIDEIRSLDIAYVVAISRWNDEDNDVQHFLQPVERLLETGVHIVFSEIVPSDPSFDPRKRALSLAEIPVGNDHIPFREYLVADYDRDSARLRDIFRQLETRFGDAISVVKPARYLCDEVVCPFAMEGNVPTHIDGGHVSPQAAKLLLPLYQGLFEQLQNNTGNRCVEWNDTDGRLVPCSN